MCDVSVKGVGFKKGGILRLSLLKISLKNKIYIMGFFPQVSVAETTNNS